MPHVDGFALMKQMRSRVPDGAFVPVLVLTADNSRKAKQDALPWGRRISSQKPLDVMEVSLRIYNLLETRWLHVELRRHNETLEEKVQHRTLGTRSGATGDPAAPRPCGGVPDDCTGQHTQRVGHLAALLGRAIGLPKDHVELIRRAAPLHDVGKIGIPDGILLKPSSLTAEEYSQIKDTHRYRQDHSLGKQISDPADGRAHRIASPRTVGWPRLLWHQGNGYSLGGANRQHRRRFRRNYARPPL